MREPAQRFLAALQLADSALPIGRFVHSGGLEALLQAEPAAGEREIAELVQANLIQSVGPIDGVAVAEAHRAERRADLQFLLELDRLVTTRKLIPASRIASTSCGGQLAFLASFLTVEKTISQFCKHIHHGEADGNLAVVEGALAASLGLTCEEAVLIEIRGAAFTLLSAAMRLGRISGRRVQAALHGCAPVIMEAATQAMSLSTESMHSTTPEIEIYALRHRHADTRLFAT